MIRESSMYHIPTHPQKKSDGDKIRGQIRLVMGLSSAVTYLKPNLQPLHVYVSPFSFVTSILVPVFF